MAQEERRKSSKLPFGKQTRVREVVKGAVSRGCVVSTGDDLLAVCKGLAESSGVHTVAVVDEEGRLAGIIPMRLLTEELLLDVAPEEFLVAMREMEDVEEFGRISRARTAGELMEEPAYVTMEEGVPEAFARMHERKLEGLPIVDEGLKVIGYLDLFQLLRLWVKGQERG